MDYEYEKVIFNKENERHVEMARECCDEHEFFYKTHTCEPTWDENGDLDIYLVTLHENQKIRDAFVKKRNKKRNHTPKKYKRKQCYILLQLNA